MSKIDAHRDPVSENENSDISENITTEETSMSPVWPHQQNDGGEINEGRIYVSSSRGWGVSYIL